MTTIEEALESYMNGNISDVKAWLDDNWEYDLGDFLEHFITMHGPTNEDIVHFVRRLA
tara:strand:- start:411 stop:584 length:174 start_codon:yes stop_codon:yes gene_type:complete